MTITLDKWDVALAITYYALSAPALIYCGGLVGTRIGEWLIDRIDGWPRGRG